MLVMSVLLVSSCDSYLDKQEDEAMTFEKIWNNRLNIEQYLNNVWGFMPEETNWAEAAPNPVVWEGASDATAITFDRPHRWINFGTWGPMNIPRDSYRRNYNGIHEATLFIQHIDNATAENLSDEEKRQFKAEARFARAYYYFQLFKMYGPVILLGQELLDYNQTLEELSVPRNTLEETIEFIVSEFEACAEVLPLEQPSVFYGKPTKGACYAIIARTRLYEARPLFNGNALYRNVANPDGTPLFPQSYDANKWRIAAEAAKRVIDMSQYQLFEDPSGDPHKSYQNLFLQNWNRELIFSRIVSGRQMLAFFVPRGVGGVAYGGIGPTQQQVDAYAMNNGVYPITGYNANGDPIIDPDAGYSETGFSNFAHPIDQPSGQVRQKRTYNMYINREPRFYAQVVWSGADWMYMSSNVSVNFAFNGNSGPGLSHNYSTSGYSVRKYCDPTLNTVGNQWGTLTFPLARLGEIYLNYVEALNEYDPSNSDILVYLNQIRQRAGVPDIETAYPSAVGNQQQMRELIRRERRVELAFENHRYFDTRTWMISPQVDRGPIYGMNIMEPATSLHVTPDNFYRRTVFETRVFENKHYLFPYSQTELDRNKLITQNYGW